MPGNCSDNIYVPQKVFRVACGK